METIASGKSRDGEKVGEVRNGGKFAKGGQVWKGETFGNGGLASPTV